MSYRYVEPKPDHRRKRSRGLQGQSRPGLRSYRNTTGAFHYISRRIVGRSTPAPVLPVTRNGVIGVDVFVVCPDEKSSQERHEGSLQEYRHFFLKKDGRDGKRSTRSDVEYFIPNIDRDVKLAGLMSGIGLTRKNRIRAIEFLLIKDHFSAGQIKECGGVAERLEHGLSGYLSDLR